MKAHAFVASTAFFAGLGLAFLVPFLAVPSVAFAQDAPPPLPAPLPPPPPPPSSTTDPAPPTAVPPTYAPGSPASTTCVLSDHAGIEDADAQTAGRLVCDEITRAGAPAGSHYHVHLGKLGSVLILSVDRDGTTPGTIGDTRQIRLQGIEEVSVAAPRIADAIVHGTPMADTKTTENLVGEDTRRPRRASGEMHFALGLEGMLPPLDMGLGPAPGLIMDLHYEASRIEIGGSVRFGGAATSDTDTYVDFFAASLGARYFFTDSDIAPYLGGGFAWEWLNLVEPSQNFQSNNGGGAAYIDGGVELLRTHSAHLAIGARLDLPFFSLNNSVSGAVSPAGTFSGATTNPPAPSTTSRVYYAPVSLEMRFTF